YIMESFGKRVRVACNDEISKKFDYITSRTFPEFEPKYAVTVDVASPELIGFEVQYPLLCVIDHHMNNRVECNAKFVKSDKASCGEIIFEFALLCGVKFDEYLAKCLYTAIVTDTGLFKYDAVKETTYLAGAYLSRYISGEERARLNLRHFDIKTMAQFKVEQYAIENIHLHFGGTLGIVVITDTLKEELGASDEDMECLSQLARQIDTVETSVSVKPKSEGVYKISVRTKEYVDAAGFCALFGGGGHKRAAGCAISGTAAEVEQKIVEAYRKTVVEK
ncbi:MAG: hypothetical protein IJO52_06960, partial [Clostridia bacterium]|nr:hypothetical protein [Clostridia bacterium]